MSDYTYKDTRGDTLTISADPDGAVIETCEEVIFLAPQSAPEAALAILEAAGYDAMTEGALGAAISELRAHQFAVESEAARLADMEAEADRNALEAEAERFFEGFKAYLLTEHRSWSDLEEPERASWRLMVTVSREIHQDGAA